MTWTRITSALTQHPKRSAVAAWAISTLGLLIPTILQLAPAGNEERI